MRNLVPIVLALLVFPCSLQAQSVAPESKRPQVETLSSANKGQGPSTGDQ